MEQGLVATRRKGEHWCHPGQHAWLSSSCTLFLCLSLLCRENKDCQDPEALQVLWESQAG